LTGTLCYRTWSGYLASLRASGGSQVGSPRGTFCLTTRSRNPHIIGFLASAFNPKRHGKCSCWCVLSPTSVTVQGSGLRRHQRLLHEAPLEIVWTDSSGRDNFQRARAIEISESGMQIEMAYPIKERTYVTVRAEAVAVHGTASVRSCLCRGLKYRIGLEFSGGLRWPMRAEALAPAPVL
jgi:hypothetical protein